MATITDERRPLEALIQLRSESYAEPEGVDPGWVVPCRTFDGTELQELALLAGDNQNPQDIVFDNEALADLLTELSQAGELEGSGYSDARLEQLIGELCAEQPEEGAGGTGEGDGSGAETARRTLAERFGVPPFSVLDARQGYWQTRKQAWLALGIESELGRGGGGRE